MPQVVVVIDNRIACETTLHDQSSDQQDHNHNHTNNQEEDFPAESYYLAKEDEFDWIDRNANSAILDRRNSAKATTHHHISSKSQRFKPKPSIIGLPKPPPNPTSSSSAFFRRASANPSAARFFPKRSGSSSRKSLGAEPSSPKVSCIGRVRSKRVRSFKCRSSRRRRDSDESTTSSARKKSAGFWSGFRDALRLGCRKPRAVEVEERSAEVVSPGTERRKKAASPPGSEQVVGPPGLGGMNRFVSGRRSESWAGEVVGERDSVDRGLGSGGPQEVC